MKEQAITLQHFNESHNNKIRKVLMQHYPKINDLNLIFTSEHEIFLQQYTRIHHLTLVILQVSIMQDYTKAPGFNLILQEITV